MLLYFFTFILNLQQPRASLSLGASPRPVGVARLARPTFPPVRERAAGFSGFSVTPLTPGHAPRQARSPRRANRVTGRVPVTPFLASDWPRAATPLPLIGCLLPAARRLRLLFLFYFFLLYIYFLVSHEARRGCLSSSSRSCLLYSSSSCSSSCSSCSSSSLLPGESLFFLFLIKLSLSIKTPSRNVHDVHDARAGLRSARARSVVGFSGAVWLSEVTLRVCVSVCVCVCGRGARACLCATVASLHDKVCPSFYCWWVESIVCCSSFIYIYIYIYVLYMLYIKLHNICILYYIHNIIYIYIIL